MCCHCRMLIHDSSEPHQQPIRPHQRLSQSEALKSRSFVDLGTIHGSGTCVAAAERIESRMSRVGISKDLVSNAMYGEA